MQQVVNASVFGLSKIGMADADGKTDEAGVRFGEFSATHLRLPAGARSGHHRRPTLGSRELRRRQPSQNAPCPRSVNAGGAPWSDP